MRPVFSPRAHPGLVGNHTEQFWIIVAVSVGSALVFCGLPIVALLCFLGATSAALACTPLAARTPFPTLSPGRFIARRYFGWTPKVFPSPEGPALPEGVDESYFAHLRQSKGEPKSKGDAHIYGERAAVSSNRPALPYLALPLPCTTHQRSDPMTGEAVRIKAGANVGRDEELGDAGNTGAGYGGGGMDAPNDEGDGWGQPQTVGRVDDDKW